MSMHIGPVTDFTALHALFADVYTSTDSMCAALEEKYPDQAAFHADMQTLLARPGGLVLTADDGHGLLGYVTITPRPQAKLRHTADLSMGVAARARGQGVGRQLLAAALQRVRAPQGPVQILYLMVRADNTAAIRLYADAGFAVLGRLEKDIRIGTAYYDGLLMRAWVGAEAD